MGFASEPVRSGRPATKGVENNGDCGIPDNAGMFSSLRAAEPVRHLLVPFASASAPECRALLPQLRLPHLEALLADLSLAAVDEGDDHSPSMPHERALATALGIVQANGAAFADGHIPWAAALSQDPTTPQAWFTPCHFQVGMDQVSLLPADQIGLTDADARPLFEALAPFCQEDGITLRYDSATRWHASGEPLRDLACASLDRVSGRALNDWVQAPSFGSPLIKRLQSEAQMLFYTHPANDAREAARQHIINGFWVSGAGVSPQAANAARAPRMPETLRHAALQADWRAWLAAWTELDATSIRTLHEAAQRGEPVALTLCGERCGRHWHSRPAHAGARFSRLLRRMLRSEPTGPILESL
jgi:hypothetical protein